MTRKQKYKAYNEILIYFKEIHNLMSDMCIQNCKKCDGREICLSLFFRKQPRKTIMAMKRKYR